MSIASLVVQRGAGEEKYKVGRQICRMAGNKIGDRTMDVNPIRVGLAPCNATHEYSEEITILLLSSIETIKRLIASPSYSKKLLQSDATRLIDECRFGQNIPFDAEWPHDRTVSTWIA